MPVDSTHPGYDANVPSWLRARDVIAGAERQRRLRSAELNSAVSQNCILPGPPILESVRNQRHLADYKSAIRQSATLRYACGPAMRWACWWNSTEPVPSAVDTSKVSIQLNTDFNTKEMSSDELTAVVSAWQAGAISRETMFEILRRGEVLFDGPTSEQEGRVVTADASAEKNDQQKG